MKSLFKYKKIIMLSSAIALPITGVMIAVPLLVQQHSTSHVLSDSEISSSQFIQSFQHSAVKENKQEGEQKVNKIYKKGDKYTVTWKDATISQVSKELSENFPPPPPQKPSKISVNVVITPKVEVPKKPETEFKPTTLIEKISQFLKTKVKGNETKEELSKLKAELDQIKSEHHKQNDKNTAL